MSAPMSSFIRVTVLSALLSSAVLSACASAQTASTTPEAPRIEQARVEQIISTLADDDMRGRSAFSADAVRAAEYLAGEFADAGLESPEGADGYLQWFSVPTPTRGAANVGGNGGASASEQGLVNVVGMIPGRRSDEYVLFSAHYDHIGIREPVAGDSIANGANDNASGTTAVVMLGRYFAERGTPERTLLFAAFTAEERGGFGSRYYSTQLDPDQIVAMFNIEMIGKPAVQGPNTAWITGFEQSSFGLILQEAVTGTEYEFYPDPYPDQRLFYRSDNATLARSGVPAHSISTTPIDVDQDYHQVTDHVETLDLEHLTNTIRAIAMGAETIVSGAATPTRVDLPDGN